MKWEEFIRKVQGLSVVETELLLAGGADPAVLQVQISRWAKAGKLIPIRRGWYLLAEPYRKTPLVETALAGLLCAPSYVSMEMGLEWHGLIPDATAMVTSVTTRRPARFVTPVGTFDYRHIQPSLFWGYTQVTIRSQTAMIALPEKALLDIVYLRHVSVSEDYLRELRLQQLSRFNLKRLMGFARRFGYPRILLAAGEIRRYVVKARKEERAR
ncbi:MAG: hypothetical protein A2Z34_06885 [Planctomycetes bacterium RBG_16_59_8]|nr:MAG: hypothetical protein A2Z34_06885 [Planctomycetes bacterium RBG_16_59_8]